MKKLKELCENTFENKDFIKGLQQYIKSKTFEEWLSVDEWKTKITELYQIDFNNPQLIKQLKLMSQINYLDKYELDEQKIYRFYDEINAYIDLTNDEIKDDLIELGYDYIVEDFKNQDLYTKFYIYLKRFEKDVYNEVKLDKRWYDINEIKKHYEQLENKVITFKDSYSKNEFNSQYKYLLFDLVRNDDLKKDVWYNWQYYINEWKELNEETLKQHTIKLIENKNEWKGEFKKLRENDYQKFRDFDKYLNNKLSNILFRNHSR